MPFQVETPTSPAKSFATARPARTRRFIARDLEHACDRDRTAGDRAPGELIRDRTVQPKTFGKDKYPGAPYPPTIEEMAMRQRLAHGGAAEDNALGQEKVCVGRQIRFDRAAQPDLVEEDRLLRQPAKRTAGTDLELHANFGV